MQEIAYATSGAFLAAPEPAVRPPSSGLVGVVCDDMDAALEYLEDLAGPYVVIRDAAEVPERLGGVAVLLTGEWPPGLADALARALGVQS